MNGVILVLISLRSNVIRPVRVKHVKSLKDRAVTVAYLIIFPPASPPKNVHVSDGCLVFIDESKVSLNPPFAANVLFFKFYPDCWNPFSLATACIVIVFNEQ